MPERPGSKINSAAGVDLPPEPALQLPPGWPAGTYDVVYSDPPWQYWGDAKKQVSAAGKHYELMTLDAVCALPVRSLMSDRSVCFVWATGPKLHFALKAIESWGLHYRGVAYVWVKTTKGGRVIGGQGAMPTFTKPTTEFVLAATTVARGRPFPILDLAQHQVVLAARQAHSTKPAEVRRRIEALCGDRRRLEMFARGDVAGWDAWGLEACSLAEVDDAAPLMRTGDTVAAVAKAKAALRLAEREAAKVAAVAAPPRRRAARKQEG